MAAPSPRTKSAKLAARTKRARKTRTADEFDITRLMAMIEPLKGTNGGTRWTLEQIVSAVDAQMAGYFAQPAALAEAMRADDALFVARENRLAPQRCTKVEMVPAKGSRGASIAAEADALFGQNGIAIQPDTLRDINDCLVNHAVAFARAVQVPRDDGSRVDCIANFWPIRWVRWDPYARVYKTQVEGGPEEIITHGDGRWIVFQEGEHEPFKNGVVIAAARVWARHAFALRDWEQGSLAHGSAKMVGEMPAGVALQDSSGLTAEATAFLALLKSMVGSRLPYGIRPAGSKTEFVTNTSTAWQVWQELVSNAEKGAARIYLGTDGTLGSNGGAPGVDIAQLFGVALTKVQGDLAAIERGLRTGLIEPWCAMNFGDSSLAPTRKYVIPDADQDAARESNAKRRQAFYADIEAAKKSGADVTQAFIDARAAEFDVESFTLKVAAQVPATAPTNGVTKPAVPASPSAS